MSIDPLKICMTHAPHETLFPVAVEVGALPNLAHQIGGVLEILTTTRIRIRDFTYDGQGICKFTLKMKIPE